MFENTAHSTHVSSADHFASSDVYLRARYCWDELARACVLFDAALNGEPTPDFKAVSDTDKNMAMIRHLGVTYGQCEILARNSTPDGIATLKRNTLESRRRDASASFDTPQFLEDAANRKKFDAAFEAVTECARERFKGTSLDNSIGA